MLDHGAFDGDVGDNMPGYGKLRFAKPAGQLLRHRGRGGAGDSQVDPVPFPREGQRSPVGRAEIRK